MSKRETRALMAVALGQRPAQLYIENCRLVNVYTGEVLEGQGIATWGERIAYVGSLRPKVGPKTQVIDGRGLFLLPGFIDVHAHLDLFQNPISLAEVALPTGTVAAYAESHDILGALGLPGLELLLGLADRLPFHLFVGLAPAQPQFPQWEGEEVLSLQQTRRYLKRKGVLGLSEFIPWTRLLAQEEQLLDRLEAAKGLGKRIEGHTAGVSGSKLEALVAAGLTSCHESITAQELMERLRLGLHTILRHGSIRADVEELARPFRQDPALDTSRVMLSPDTVFPPDLMAKGYMDHVIASAVEAGIPPIKAIQMATINPATYLGLESQMGGIGPGRYADLVLVADLRHPTPELVICRGRVVAAQGRLLEPLGLSLVSWTKLPWREGRWPRRGPRVEDFQVPTSYGDGSVTVPAIHVGHKVITQRREVTLPVLDGQVSLDSGQDVLKLALVNKAGDGFVTGFLSGLGVRLGALATTIAHDHHHAMVLGSREEEMVLALKRLEEIGGGMTLIEGGQVAAEIPAPIGGLLPIAPLPEVATQMENMTRWLQDRGCPLESPLFTIVFLSFASLPALRITPSGVLDVKAGRIIFP
jgi:adenine deaminase